MIVTEPVGTEILTLYENVAFHPTQFIMVGEILVGYRIANHPPFDKYALVAGEVVRGPYQGETEEL